MPRARYTADGGTYRVAGISFEPGDEHEVDRELATYLSDHDDFEVIVEKAAPEEDSDSCDAGDGEADSDGDEEADEFDAAEFVDRTPMSEVVEDIHDGKADEHLAELDELDDLRVGVDDAIGERRAELEG